MSERWLSYPELQAVVGKDKAEALCQALGGLLTYLPHTPKPSHPFAPILGMPALHTLAAYAGGWHISLPNLRRPEAMKGQILELLAQGLPHREIAERLGVSQRWIRQLAAEQRAAAGQPQQLRLF